MLKGTWNFFYVLPQFNQENNIGKIDIVVPDSLQMVWSKFPEYFCSAPETARDIANTRERKTIGSIPENTLEKHIMKKLSTALPAKPYMLQLARWIIEIYVDDFFLPTYQVTMEGIQ